MLLTLLTSPAYAFDSEPMDLVLEDLADLFQSAEFSTGWVPSGSPLQVQFAIESNGGAWVSMEGDANLSWPDAFRLDYVPLDGELTLDGSIDAVTSVQIDLSDWGYQGTWEIDRRSLTMAASTLFDPFLLDGAPEPRIEVTDPGNPNELIYYSYQIIAGLSLDFAASLRTETTAGFTGVQWASNDYIATQSGQAVSLPAEAVADYLVQSVYTGEWDALLDLVLTPSMEVCAEPFGCVTVVEFDIPIPLISTTFTQDFPPTNLVFPLPLLSGTMDTTALGDVQVGQIANVNVALTNAGSLTATGTAHIEGSTDFSVFPNDFSIPPGGADGVVVTFWPTVEGPVEAFLVLDSNDPSQPQLVYTLSANGLGTDGTGEVTDDEPTEKPLAGCGCGTGTGAPWWMVGIAALLLVRRRP